ncbi:MAG: SPASM domain-containing protein [Chitinophagales bacterium]|nr:SPASM domain-containing protein [Chitinophagales bacterium]
MSWKSRGYDGWNFLAKLSPYKAWNILLVFASFHLSRLIKRPVQWGLPFNISFEPTTSCNLRCPECPSGLRSFTRSTGMLEMAFFQKTIDEMRGHLAYLYLYFQGEPYLHPRFLDLVRHASRQNIYTVTSTNAHYLNDANARKTVESGLDRIIISIDGTSQETYQAYRVGGNLEKVIEGTKRLLHWKKELQSKTPYVIFQFLVVKPNEQEVPEVYRLAKELGVDEVKLKTAQVYEYEKGHPLIPDNDRYARYRRNPDGSYSLKNKLLNHCWKLWHSCVITWDGKIVPCCFDKDAAHPMGDLQQQPFTAIWKDEPYRQFREKLMGSRKSIDICQNCTEGTKVWA